MYTVSSWGDSRGLSSTLITRSVVEDNVTANGDEKLTPYDGGRTATSSGNNVDCGTSRGNTDEVAASNGGNHDVSAANGSNDDVAAANGMITTSLEEGTRLPLPTLNTLPLSLGPILPPTVLPLLLLSM